MAKKKKIGVANLPGPCSERQEMFVSSDLKGVDITLFGGAAGSGKSEIGVIDILKYTDVPGFISVIVRRTTPQLKGPGSLLSKCHRVFGQAYDSSEFTWKDKEGKFVFHKSGAEVYLKHYENENCWVNYQGIETNHFLIDEGTQFTKDMISYMMSRMRNPNCPQVSPHMKITCNPDRDHFLYDWVEPYLKEDGTPDRSKDGKIRYLGMRDGDFFFADTKEEVMDACSLDSEDDVLSFCYISANVNDNPILKKVNPRYVSWLKGLKGVERDRLLYGNWKVREESSGFFKREWFVEEDKEPDRSEIVRTVRAYDFAGELVSDLKPNPDYSASCKMSLLKNGRYYIHHVERFRKRFGQHISHVIENAKKDGDHVDIIIPEDPNAAAKEAAIQMTNGIIQEGSQNGMMLRVRRVKTNRSKLDRFRPFSSAAQNGLLHIKEFCGDDHEAKQYNNNNWYYYELERFTGERDRSKEGHDD